ncbi:hypothetical protein E0L21_00030 [Kosakonia quasisacchari]|uniref:SH3 domain-containing protein n=1 Tax=Kosakonia quasisacchari TaxID=2529380 RepID=A0A4R0HW12_9ENTR|nr:hypothetical protein [Kosakonia quasisacchari]TCC14684.1 hypothetical protein E0L21_00030 [Kosakonia quasisacchari]
MRNIVLALTLSVSTAPFAATLQSGVYEELQLAVSPSGEVTGYYSETMGVGVTRNCAFALAGNVSQNGEAEISSWSSDVLPGHLSATADGVTLKIANGQSHDGCMNVMVPQINEGIALSKTQSTQWISLAEVVDDRVYLSSTPDASTRRKAWIVKDDVVGVLKTGQGWTQIQFISEAGKSTTGWVNSKSIKPLTPPAG